MVLLCVLALTPARADELIPCPTPGKILKPIISTHTLPHYPRSASSRDEQGITAVTVSVGTNGIPTDVAITQSSGSQRLDEAAVESAKTYRWEPPFDDCKPAAAQALIITGWHIGKRPKPLFGIYMPESAYPPGAIERSEMGDTFLELTIDDDGTVKDGRIVYSSGYADLDEAALSALKAAPGAMKGRPAGTNVVLARWKMSAQSPSAERLEIFTTR